MQRGCWLLVAVAVFATAPVGAVDPVNSFAVFDGTAETIDFNLPAFSSGQQLGNVATATNTVDFNGTLFVESMKGVNRNPSPPGIISPIDIDFASPVEIVAFRVAPFAGTPGVDITFAPSGETLTYTFGAATIIGGSDAAGISGISITPNVAGGVITVDDFMIQAAVGAFPSIFVTPEEPVDFGTVAIGDTADVIFTIGNDIGATAPLELASVVASGSAAFSVTSDPGAVTLNPGDFVMATVTFAPLSQGTHNGTLTINSDDPGSPTTRALTGMAPAGAPVIDVDPSAIDFGEVFEGDSLIRTLEISNDGDSNLNLTEITMGGGVLSPQNDFDVPLLSGDFPPAFPVVVPPGGSVTFNVIYSPSNVGVDMDSIEINSNDPVTPFLEVLLDGEGIPQLFSEIDVVPASLRYDFGARFVDTGSSRPIIVTNAGTAALAVSSITLTGPGRSQYLLRGAPTDDEGAVVTTILDPGESLSVTVTFRPTRVGRSTASVVIVSTDPDEASVRVSITGTGLLEEKPEIVVDPAAVDFGPVFVGAAATQAVTITNNGTEPLIVSNVAVAEGSSPDFSITGELVLPIELAAGASTSVDLTFTPSALGPAEGALSIESNDEDESVTDVPLSGTGAPTPDPEITIDTDPSLDFGQVQAGTSATKTATIRNTGVAILDVTDISLTEGTSAEFTYEGPASVSLVPGAEVELSVTYAPVDQGFDGGALAISSDDPDEPTIEVSLSGTGVADPTAKIDVETDPALAYGQVSVGASPTKTITIHNVGNANLEVTDIALGEGTSADYSITDSPVLPVSIAPGANVTVVVAYAPGDLGFDSGTVVITSSDESDPVTTVSLTGVGSDQLVAAIEVDPDSLEFGDVNLGSDSTMTITVRNVGSGDLTVNSVALGDGSSDQYSIGDLVLPASLVPLGEMSVDVTLAATAAGAAGATVVIESDDPDDPAVVVSANGNGVEAPPAPQLGTDPAELTFGDVEIGTSSVLELTLSNNGDADLTVTSIGLGDGTSANFTLDGVPDSSTSILMLGADAGPTFAADPAVFGILAGQYGEAAVLGDPGVFYMQGEVSTTEDAALVDVVYISSTLGSGSVRGKFEDAATPLLNCEQALMNAGTAGNFYMSTTAQTSADQTQLDILAPGHPLAAGLDGTVDVFTEPQIFSVGNPPLAPGVIAIAQATSDANLVGIFAAEAGAELLGDGSDGAPATAAARRVMFFTEDNGGNVLTDDGLSLLLAAVEWLAQPAVAVIPPGESIVVSVTYSPDAEATDTGTVRVESNGGDASVALNGTGVPGAVMQIRISPPSVDFGGTLIGTTSNADVTIRNLGTANLDLSGVALGVGTSQTFNITAAPAAMTVEPGAETTVKVSYTPVVTLANSGTVRIASNDQKRPEVSVSLFGFGAGEISAPVFKRGDANSDSTVDISDVVKTLTYLFGGGSAPDCHDAADSNDDGSLDVSDGLFTVSRLFGGSNPQPLPPVAESCAIDGSADNLPDCNYPLDSCGI